MESAQDKIAKRLRDEGKAYRLDGLNACAVIVEEAANKIEELHKDLKHAHKALRKILNLARSILEREDIP